MPTTKHRINLAVPADMDRTLHELARRDEASVATKTLHLIRRALELEEDLVLQKVAESRERK